MFSLIRRRATYANVALTLTLVFAMTGGAYAAKKYLITSTKQISPSVLKQLAGKPGANGKDGAPGAQGATGPQGPAGANGKDGANGVNGKDGAPGAQGTTGPQGPTGTKGAAGPAGQINTEGPLPAGSTETGGWDVGGATYADPPWHAASTTVSFPIPLAADLSAAQVETKEIGYSGEPEANCPGSAAKPEAKSGFLCIYTTKLINSAVPIPIAQKLTETTLTNNPVATEGASTSGALVLLIASLEETSNVAGWGSWAVTG